MHGAIDPLESSTAEMQETLRGLQEAAKDTQLSSNRIVTAVASVEGPEYLAEVTKVVALDGDSATFEGDMIEGGFQFADAFEGRKPTRVTGAIVAFPLRELVPQLVIRLEASRI